MQLILASSSRYRKELLSRLCIPFICMAPDVDETPLANETAPALVKRLACAKAEAIALQTTDSLVIGSDQVAVSGSAILTKSGNHENARRQLQSVSGHEVVFYTGLCVIATETRAIQSAVVPYSVSFRQLSDTQIDNYLYQEQPYDCAGSFKAEGLGISLFEKMQGDDPTALIGLPLITLTSMLTQAGIHVI